MISISLNPLNHFSQAHLPDRLQIALERMAKGKGSEGPNHFFDLQHQTAVSIRLRSNLTFPITNLKITISQSNFSLSL